MVDRDTYEQYQEELQIVEEVRARLPARGEAFGPTTS
jgi:hypothetical protein